VTAARSEPGSGSARGLLFERLIEPDPGLSPGAGRDPLVPPSARVDPARAALERSVARELSALLNTRALPAVDAVEPEARTILEYGFPDPTGLSPQSGSDRGRLARAAERAIRAFEPRLAEPRVTVLDRPAGVDGLAIVIEGVLTTGTGAAPFAFDLRVTGTEGGDGE
jgi:type VI secretion system protein ImpF